MGEGERHDAACVALLFSFNGLKGKIGEAKTYRARWKSLDGMEAGTKRGGDLINRVTC